jgi:type I restriction enzyme, R subunit
VRNGKKRRPDIVAFVNGIPLALVELKNLPDEHATLKGAWNQIQTYRGDIPAIFTPNPMTVISDGTSAAMSAFTGAQPTL